MASSPSTKTPPLPSLALRPGTNQKDLQLRTSTPSSNTVNVFPALFFLNSFFLNCILSLKGHFPLFLGPFPLLLCDQIPAPLCFALPSTVRAFGARGRGGGGAPFLPHSRNRGGGLKNKMDEVKNKSRDKTRGEHAGRRSALEENIKEGRSRKRKERRRDRGAGGSPAFCQVPGFPSPRHKSARQT